MGKKSKYICCIGAKSGGHIIPAIFYGKNHIDKYKLTLFTSNNNLDKTIVQNYDFISHHCTISLGNFPEKKILKYPKFLIQLILSFFKSLIFLIKYRPAKIINFGSYISVPISLAAWVLRVPVVLFELNTVPGKAIKFLVPISQKVKICFKQAKNYFPINKVIYESYPIRFKETDKLSKIEACKKLGLNPHEPVLFILGGSQGSEFINNFSKSLILKNFKDLERLQVIHQAGNKQITEIKEFYQKNNIRSQVFEFSKNLSLYYNAADFVLSRAGAGTLFELLYFKKKSIIIPLKSSITDHQINNAQALEKEHPELFKVYLQEKLNNFIPDIKIN